WRTSEDALAALCDLVKIGLGRWEDGPRPAQGGKALRWFVLSRPTSYDSYDRSDDGPPPSYDRPETSGDGPAGPGSVGYPTGSAEDAETLAEREAIEAEGTGRL